jgi:hypothetical protein
MPGEDDENTMRMQSRFENGNDNANEDNNNENASKLYNKSTTSAARKQ